MESQPAKEIKKLKYVAPSSPCSNPSLLPYRVLTRKKTQTCGLSSPHSPAKGSFSTKCLTRLGSSTNENLSVSN